MSFLLKSILLFQLITIIFCGPIPSQISCRDELGQPIDWFTAYKLPKLKTAPNVKYLANGTAHTFITDKNQDWTLSNKEFSDPTSIAGNTLDVLYSAEFSDSQNLGYVMYNDQSLPNDLATRAHAKGVIIFNDKTAIWLVHSIPHFPPKREDKEYVLYDEQKLYAQSMICLSLPFSALSQVGLQLFFAYPQIYDSFIPSSMSSDPVLKNLVTVVSGKRTMVPPWTNIEKIKTVGNQEFITLHKHTNFADDLYVNLVAKSLKSDFFTETWSRGVGTKDSNCTQEFSVNNILIVSFLKWGVKFGVTSDHSKWAISQPRTSSDLKYVCIGDINRQDSQAKRGGGTICFNNNLNVWNAYHTILNDVKECPNQATISVP